MKYKQSSIYGIAVVMVGMAPIAFTGCSEADEAASRTDVVSTESAIIAGVDAKSTALDSIGSLVQIYRYTICSDPYSCGVGGSTGRTTVTSIASGTGGPARVPAVPAGAVNPRSGRLDRVMPVWATAGSAGGAGGSAATSPGCRSSVGGSTSVGTGGSTSTGPIEVVIYWPFCSGTLIGPTAVTTAKHCLMDLDYMTDIEVGFAVGPDAMNPTAVYPIVDWEWETEVAADPNSLLADLGSDVGVAHLGAAVSGVTPMAIGTLTDEDVNKRFTAVGYGIQNNRGDNGTRKAGSLTLRGIGGNYADYAFGGLQGFLKAAKSMPAFQGLPDDYLTQIYDQLALLPEYQAFLGGRPGDAQPCYGDSGAPLVATRNGVRTVFGNVTSGFGSSRLICDYGAVFAVYGPLTQAFLQVALEWVDPCAGLTVQGYCDGDQAIRCTNGSEGKRRVSDTDCGLLGQTCGLDATGAAACVDPVVSP